MALPPLVEPAAELTKDEVARYSRHLIIPDVGMDGQKRLKNAKVLVVGAGGLGSPALMYLAAAGVGTLGDHRLRRRRRVQPAAPDHPRPVRHRSPEGRVGARLGARDQPARRRAAAHRAARPRTNALEIFADYDLILDGTDNFATRYLVNDAAVLLGKPYVWGSIFRFEGQASVFWEDAPNGQGLNYRDLYPEPPPPGMVPSCAEGGVLGVLCASIGSIMVTEAIKLITGIGEPLLGRLMVFDALEMSYRTIRIRKDPESKPITELIDYDAFCGVVSDDAQRAAADSTITANELKEMIDAGKSFELIDVREPHEYEIVEHPGRQAGAEGPHPVRRGARRDAAGPPDRAALQDRRALRRGAGRAAQGRLRRRGARRRRGGGLGQAGRPLAAHLLTPVDNADHSRFT